MNVAKETAGTEAGLKGDSAEETDTNDGQKQKQITRKILQRKQTKPMGQMKHRRLI